VSKRELWLMGSMLYWAEGSKQKNGNVGQRVIFSNSDPLIIKVYLKWLREVLLIEKGKIDFEIYSHNNIIEREKEVIKYWSKITGFPISQFRKIYYKKDKKNDYRKNQGQDYYGLLRVIILKSTDLNRKISGWIRGVCEEII